MEPTIATLQNHIKALCFIHKIFFLPVKTARKCCAFKHHQVNCLSIRSYLSYAIALHEIGHCRTYWRSGYWFPMKSYGTLRREHEALAWDWARENALIWTLPMHWAHRYSWKAHNKSTNRWAIQGFMAKNPSPIEIRTNEFR